jgi:hypothetical protein
MLNDNLLQEFIHGFYGYGNYKAPFWFIGMEEGGGGSFVEIRQRLAIWDTRGHRELEDVADYHRAFGITKHWDEPVSLQSTWGKLIRVLMGAKGLAPSPSDLKDYQRDHLGRESGETCLLELMPLPSPGMSKWFYGDISTLPYLVNREKYLKEISPVRIKHIQSQISIYKPPVVLFYGLGYMSYWQEIAGIPLEQQKLEGVYCGRTNTTVFAAMKHPAARGLDNEYFKQIGKGISSAIVSSV